MIGHVAFWKPQCKGPQIEESLCEVKINLYQGHALRLNAWEEEIRNYNSRLIIALLTKNRLARPDFSLPLLSHCY